MSGLLWVSSVDSGIEHKDALCSCVRSAFAVRGCWKFSWGDVGALLQSWGQYIFFFFRFPFSPCDLKIGYEPEGESGEAQCVRLSFPSPCLRKSSSSLTVSLFLLISTVRRGRGSDTVVGGRKVRFLKFLERCPAVWMHDIRFLSVCTFSLTLAVSLSLLCAVPLL